MKHKLIIGLSVLALCSCSDNLFYTETEVTDRIITGNTYKTGFAQSSPLSTFSEGSQIMLNASGGLQTSNEVLTYTNGQWKTENQLLWSNKTAATNVTALYPVYPDLTYSKENLYSTGMLEDVLYAKDEYPADGSICLQFNHQFSLLTLHLDGELQSGFQKMEVTCPVVVSAITPESTEITFATDDAHTSSIMQVSSSGNYSFIIPPAKNMDITIGIQADGKKYTTQLPSKSFASNQEYTYNLKTSETSPGIVTAEDWIAFSQLINHKTLTEYNGKALADFGKTVDGVSTYYLKNDINFEGVDCTKLEQIGSAQNNYYFSDILDGQGHSLSNILLKPYRATTGIFGAISSTSTVKNIHIKSCNATVTPQSNSTAEGTSILVGRNKGKIVNCSVEDCEISANPTKANQSANTGGLAGTSTGQIINCYVKNVNIDYSTKTTVKAMPAGGIAGSTEGLILNCYSSNNIIKNRGSYNGGICGEASNETRIENCYIYSLDQVAPKGLLTGTADSSFFTHNYYYKTTTGLIGKSNGGNQLLGNIEYTSSFTDEAGIPVCQLLNQWIDETAPTLYPDYTFTRWTDGGESLPAIFVTESKNESK